MTLTSRSRRSTRSSRGGTFRDGTSRSEVVLFAARQRVLAMITDIFAKRYEQLRFNQDWAENIISPTVVQASYIRDDDIQPKLNFPDAFFGHVNLLLSRELGLQSLNEFRIGVNRTHASTCYLFLSQPFERFSAWHREPDYFCKTRLSMLALQRNSAH
jgi:hypothetical protein